mmetsp:Transcript_40946/g.91582  ORF Transcript_40946/g.91582 Transcript_40946/m.91582 type:complete len:236 (-) Transcript_40946:54-761(-)
MPAAKSSKPNISCAATWPARKAIKTPLGCGGGSPSPSCSSQLSTSACPRCAATPTGVAPAMSAFSLSAPLSSSNFTTSTCPCSAAISRGVVPSCMALSTSARASSSIRAHSTAPACAAEIRAVLPKSSCRSGSWGRCKQRSTWPASDPAQARPSSRTFSSEAVQKPQSTSCKSQGNCTEEVVERTAPSCRSCCRNLGWPTVGSSLRFTPSSTLSHVCLMLSSSSALKEATSSPDR